MMTNQPVVWTFWMRLAVTPVVIAGTIGLLLCAVVILVLLLLGMKPVEAVR